MKKNHKNIELALNAEDEGYALAFNNDGKEIDRERTNTAFTLKCINYTAGKVLAKTGIKYRTILDRIIDSQWESMNIFHPFGGADYSKESHGSPTINRRLAAEGADVWSIDMYPNNKNITDVYHHITGTIFPYEKGKNSIIELLQANGFDGKFDFILTLRALVTTHLDSDSEIWTSGLLYYGSPNLVREFYTLKDSSHLAAEKLKKYQKTLNEAAEKLLCEAGVLMYYNFGSNSSVYIKKNDLLTLVSEPE